MANAATEMVITEDATISSEGRVTIPKRVREAIDLEDGERLRFLVTNDGELAVRRTDEATARLEEVRDRLATLEVDLEDIGRRSAREWRVGEADLE